MALLAQDVAGHTLQGKKGIQASTKLSDALLYVRNPDLINWRLSGQSEANRALDLLLQRYHRRVLETLLKGRWRISAFLLQKIRRLYCEELVPIYHCESISDEI